MNNAGKSYLYIQLILLTFSMTAAVVSKAAVINVYVYNTEFSINQPGGPVVSAVITQGDSIRWIWVQGGHTTTSVAGSTEQWNQPINSSTPQFTRQFNSTGVFWYYCIPHGSDNGDGTASGMSSTITVLPAGSGACCLPDGICITSTEGTCIAQNGSFSGVGTSCASISCDVTLELTAVKDNILYESSTGSLSNALGNHLYTGNNSNGKRRTVLAFDLANIPVSAEVQDVQLKLFCNSSTGAGVNVTVQKLFQNWGEGTSQANGNEGNGASSTTGDATWIHTFYNTENWISAGGNFSSTISASTNVSSQNVFYTWTSTQLKTDVEYWLDNPEENFGWILRGDETSSANPKRFSSRQNATVVNRPHLLIHYIIPPTGACCLQDGTCANLTSNQCTAQNGIYQGNGTSCSETSCNIQLTPYLDPLPIPGVAVPVTGTSGGTAFYRMTMTEQFQQLHSELPPTRVWGFNGGYPGPIIEAFRDSLVTVQWINDLREAETGELRTTHPLSIDTCLQGPDVTGNSPVTVVHLHGGKVPPDSDGYPENAFPPGDSSGIYTYPNIQPAGTLWYHDHALGITRLNVMMGLAGLYFLRDNNELSLNLPSGEYEIPLVIQDKSFSADGSMLYPEMIEDHFFGNVILVNGKVWPYLQVKKGKYRFRVVNGSNSRAYKLALSNGASFTQIGSELGLLESPVVLDSLTMLPGERYDLIFDFTSYNTGTEIILTNSAPAPYPGFAGVGVIPNVLKFIVTAQQGFTGSIPQSLAEVEELIPGNADESRLFELMTIPSPPCGEHNHNMWSINGMMWEDITEFPVYGTTEIWTWHNQSGISHPMHLHLVSFQILDRQAINEVTGLPEGPLLPPAASEKGWKDTANSPPGFRTGVIARFDGFTGLYPYHCHILEHEDDEMMRQFQVRPCTLVTKTIDNEAGSLRYAINCAQPNDTIKFLPALAGDTIHLDDTLLVDKSLIFYNTSTIPVTLSGVTNDRLLVIAVGSTVSFKHLNLISGHGVNGRAIHNRGNLSLDDVSIFDHASVPGIGNAILNTGVLMIKNNFAIHTY
jgi:spore coat protein A